MVGEKGDNELYYDILSTNEPLLKESVPVFLENQYKRIRFLCMVVFYYISCLISLVLAGLILCYEWIQLLIYETLIICSFSAYFYILYELFIIHPLGGGAVALGVFIPLLILGACLYKNIVYDRYFLEVLKERRRQKILRAEREAINTRIMLIRKLRAQIWTSY